jgi:hypothetical protein
MQARRKGWQAGDGNGKLGEPDDNYSMCRVTYISETCVGKLPKRKVLWWCQTVRFMLAHI